MKKIDLNEPLLIAGPCVVESKSHLWSVAEALKEATSRRGLQWVLKSSYDKANRTSIGSFRGLGDSRGFGLLMEARDEFDVPVTSDIHSVEDAAHYGPNLDIIQVPAFLSRQTDIIGAAARAASGSRIVNVKKMQTVAPGGVGHIATKAMNFNPAVNMLITERGTQFGPNDVVVDFRRFAVEPKTYRHVMDITHTTKHWIESWPLMNAAIACGVRIIFAEVGSTKCDADRAIPINKARLLVDQVWSGMYIYDQFTAKNEENGYEDESSDTGQI
jgi:2-dehydro-3-deoxyphosphooctonate aldolase (KDO 8-P synthase)